MLFCLLSAESVNNVSVPIVAVQVIVLLNAVTAVPLESKLHRMVTWPVTALE